VYWCVLVCVGVCRCGLVVLLGVGVLDCFGVFWYVLLGCVAVCWCARWCMLEFVCVFDGVGARIWVGVCWCGLCIGMYWCEFVREFVLLCTCWCKVRVMCRCMLVC